MQVTFCPWIPHPLLKIGPTHQRTKTTRSSKGDLHTLNHTALSPSFLKQVYEILGPGLFQSGHSQLNHHKRDSQTTRSMISYSLIEPQPLPSTPWGYEFHALPTSHIYSTSSQIRVWNLVKSLRWSFLAETVNLLRSLAVFFCGGAPSLMFDGVLNATLSEQKGSTTMVTIRNLELHLPANYLDLHQTKK